MQEGKEDGPPECLRAFRLTCQRDGLTASLVAIRQAGMLPFVPASLLACLHDSLLHILLEIMSAGVVVSAE
jgi:hypothetical protein